jgi:hypothetical protein
MPKREGGDHDGTSIASADGTGNLDDEDKRAQDFNSLSNRLIETIDYLMTEREAEIEKVDPDTFVWLLVKLGMLQKLTPIKLKSDIEQYFRIRLGQVHLDLRYLLKSLGFSGGLKGCERQMGIDRGELRDIDGYYAVILWQQYMMTGNQKSLETLIEYNSADARNLETLLIMAYDMKLKETPFYETRRMQRVVICPKTDIG